MTSLGRLRCSAGSGRLGAGIFLSHPLGWASPYSRTPYFMKSGDLAIGCSNSEKDSMLSLSRSDSFRTWTGAQRSQNVENQKVRWGAAVGQGPHAECYHKPGPLPGA